MAVLTLSLAVLTLLIFLVLAPRARAKLNAVRIGKDPGLFRFHTSAAKDEFANLGHQLVEHGYQEVRRCGTKNVLINVVTIRSRMPTSSYKHKIWSAWSLHPSSSQSFA